MQMASQYDAPILYTPTALSELRPDTDTTNPPFDNFYSPHNVAFYNSSPYTPLDPLQREIRLIRLSPGSQDDPLICELTAPLPFDQAKYSYLAISYCAGDPEITTPISVNELAFNAFASLGVALRRVRASVESSRQRGGKHQMFWVDQICIDQSNPVERAHQVGFMRDIYEGAGRTMVWLGGEGSEGRGLRFLDDQCRKIEEILDEVKDEAEDGGDTLEGARQYAAEVLGKELAEDHFNNPVFVEDWMGVREVVFSPWWRRCWVAQELIVSRNDAVIMLGATVITWERFGIAFDVVLECFRTIIKKLLSRDADETLEGQELEHFLSLMGQFDTSHIQFMIEQQKEWEDGKPRKLGPLLEHARRSKSSDPRDRIYAFLGLAEPGYNIVPSYEASNSINNALCHTAKRMILHDASLCILSLAQEDNRADDADLPSWVPNWCTEHGLVSLLDNDYKASENYLPTPSFHPNLQGQNDRVLRAASLVVDQLAATEASLRKPTQQRVGSTATEWLSLADMDLHGSAETDEIYFTGETVTAAFVSTLYLGKEERIKAEDTRDEDESFNARRRSEAEKWRRRTLLENATSVDRCFFRSPKGYIGISDGRSHYTDFIVVLFGAPVPLILRKVGAYYRLIGEAYVHGFMDGEAIRLMKKGELEVKTIDII
jgi:hypothetical protein